VEYRGAELFLSDRPLRSVYRVIARDGHVVWFDCQAKIVRNRHGRPWFIHGVGFDVSDLKEAEEALKSARNDLEQRVLQRTAQLAQANADLQAQVTERLSAQTDWRVAPKNWPAPTLIWSNSRIRPPTICRNPFAMSRFTASSCGGTLMTGWTRV